MTLVKIGMEDGEEVSSFDSDYVDVSCIVTSDTGGISLAAGEAFFQSSVYAAVP